MDKTMIIAEAGVNHNGSLARAIEMVDTAKACGADIIKFQTFRAAKIASRSATQADYQKHNLGHSDKDDSQLKMLRDLELSFDDFRTLADYCAKTGIEFMSTPFDEESADFLDEIGMECFKIPSGDITNLPLLRRIAGFHKPIIMSTGMSNLQEIRDAIDIFLKASLPLESITLLHCNTEYPTPFGDVNLRAMDTMRRMFGTRVGYSDHTRGIEVPVAAVAMGAEVIEKHFTLSRSLPGPDHRASLEPEELAAMIKSIRNVELALGSPEKTPSPSEAKNAAIARKSIVAAKAIRKGERLSEKNLTTKRPGSGISPMRWDQVIGSRAIRDFEEDELIEL